MKNRERRLFRRTMLIAVFCAAILTGLGLSRRLSFYPGLLLPIVISPFLLLLRRKNLLSLYLIILLGLGLGVARGTAYMHKLHQLQGYGNQQVTVVGIVTSDAVYGQNKQLDFTINNVRLVPSSKPLVGSFQVGGFGEPMVYRGDEVEVSGKLYPTRGAHQANISYSQISVISKGSSWIDRLTRRFTTGMYNALPEPMASFGLGLLIGQRSNLPASIITQLTAVGLIHIVAVSGYNVTILSRAVSRLRLKSRYQRLVLSLVLIGGFLLMTGFSASIIRAALVSTLSLLAWYYGLKVKPIVLIGLTAAATAFFNPFYVWGDLSWYLSFLAFFGVLIVAPLIQTRFFSREPKILTGVLLETLSAELMTLPLILTYFSQLSLIAPIANLLVVPLVPVAMGLTAFAGVAGMILPSIAGWFAWPSQIILTYMLDIAHVLSRLPLSFVKVSAGAGLMIVFYVFVALLSNGLRRGVRRKAMETAKQHLKSGKI